MSALPRPDLPPGPHRELVEALHDLHHDAGWPSLRALAREAGVSHTTVSKVFSSPALPSWGTLELLVEAMDGDRARFHDLWVAASKPPDGTGHAVPRIAGRRPELDVVRRHLETGTGLLLVTGEAGIGKTTLVTAASMAAAPFIAPGAALPLSSVVPLLPVADALRAVHEEDQGRWLGDALRDCPPYVEGTLSRLLPELDPTASPQGDDEWSTQRMFGAVRAVLGSLVELRPLALLVDDLHWADTTTLDLIEHLLTRGCPVPMVGTFRLDDVSTPAAIYDWFTRVRRLPAVDSLELDMLSCAETAEQLALLSPGLAREVVDRIHRRSAGQPLFTEQLAAQSAGAGGDLPLPRLLADLLDQRLDGLAGTTWAVVRALGVADRPLTDSELCAITELTAADVMDELRELDRRRLLRPASTGPDAHLRHPLLAEAVRRRLVAGEAAAQHRRIASAFAQSAGASAAEVAAHWQGAGDVREELAWRVRAAREAASRYASASEANQWLRALELWPSAEGASGISGVTLREAYAAAVQSLSGAGERVRATDLVDTALERLADSDDRDLSELYGLAGVLHRVEDPIRGLDLLRLAVDVTDAGIPSASLVRNYMVQGRTLRNLGRSREAAEAAARAAELSAAVGDVSLRRSALALHAWIELLEGNTEVALQRIDAAVSIPAVDPNPTVAVFHTDMLLLMAAPATKVEAAAAATLEMPGAWGFDVFGTSVVCSNVSQALRRSGQVARAEELVTALSGGRPDGDLWPLHSELACIDMLRGDFERANARWEGIDLLPRLGLNTRTEITADRAESLLWDCRAETALNILDDLVTEIIPTSETRFAGQLLALHARAAADLSSGSSSPLGWASRVRDALAECETDPFAPRAAPAQGSAWGATWSAEVARLDGGVTVAPWLAAASAWDGLTHPHDAAYCRWRAAQAALRDGQGTVAARLLKRAASDAREHVPLSRAIAATLSGAP